MRLWKVLLILTTTMLPSCSPSPPPLGQSLVGKWQAQVGGAREILEFAADGTASTYYLEDGRRIAEMVGTYGVVDEKQVRMEFQGKAKMARARVVGDELFLGLPGRDVYTYRRLR